MIENRGFRSFVDLESVENDTQQYMDVYVNHGPLPMGGGSSPSSGTNSPLLELDDDPKGTSSSSSSSSSSTGLSNTGLKFLIVLALQNASKNIILRYVMKDQPEFLASAAVIAVEVVKIVMCVTYIVFAEQQSFFSILTFLRDDWKNSILLLVPSAAYSLQMTLEYVALANLDAALFSALAQSKLVITAIFAYIVMRQQLRFIQVLSLILLTTGVVLCNLQQVLFGGNENEPESGDPVKGIAATLGIAVSAGFASVYTEKVIKTKRPTKDTRDKVTYGLAYLQIQLALMTLGTIGIYAIVMDYSVILEHGLWHNFNGGALLTVLSSAVGGLTVAAVLKYADSVQKGYATAISVVMTGVLSVLLFGTELSMLYFLGILNVIIAVLMYNGRPDAMDKYVC